MAARASASEPAPAALRLAPFLILTLALRALSERPLGYQATWQQIIGDACLVAEPKRPLLGADNFRRLDGAIRPHLTEAFALADENGS
jgi:hypothetical protein